MLCARSRWAALMSPRSVCTIHTGILVFGVATRAPGVPRLPIERKMYRRSGQSLLRGETTHNVLNAWGDGAMPIEGDIGDTSEARGLINGNSLTPVARFSASFFLQTASRANLVNVDVFPAVFSD